MLPWAVLCGAAGVGLVAGVLIGAVGVGGIIIVPTLIEFPNISVQTAIAVSCMMLLVLPRACWCCHVALV